MPAETPKFTGSKVMKLTALGFKEASLDSPSFRAAVNHFHTQVLGLENWIQENTNLARNKPLSKLRESGKVEDSIINRLLPPFSYLNNGLVENQAYTPWMVNEFEEALKVFASNISKLMYGNPETYLSTYLDILVKVVKPYKEIRENFDYYQGRYDSFQRSYQEIKVSSLIDPLTIRDQAFEVFEIRKLYIDASLELLSGIGKIQLKLDELMTTMIEMTIPSTEQHVDSKYSIKIADDLENEFNRYRKWTQALMLTLDEISDDNEKSKSQIKQYCEHQYKPSSEVSDYDISSIDNSAIVTENMPSETKKAGWLYLKTSVGNSGRSFWLRRWCFLNKGLFGMLMLSPSKTYVEESDKFGVLLTSCSYNPHEDRMFCFDIKIIDKSESPDDKDIILTFQAESLTDMKAWLSSFHQAKKDASLSDEKSPEFLKLLSRISPLFVEFACSSTTKVDFLTTSIAESQSHSLLRLIQAHPNSISDYGIFQDPMFRAPVMTQITKLCIIANAFIENHGTPSALLANFWGSADTYRSFAQISNESKVSTVTKWNPTAYPMFYPEKLKPDDLLFRSLFSGLVESEGPQKELLIFKEMCFFSFGTSKDYPSTMFVTNKKIYIYINFMGFVYLNTFSWKHILGVSVVSKKIASDQGLLKIDCKDHFAINIRVFFTDAYCLCEKLLLLLENEAKKNTLTNQELLKKLDDIECSFSKASKNSKDAVAPELSLTRSLNVDKMKLRQRQQQFQLTHDAIFKMEFPVPSRALMHLMFGDKSMVFHECIFLSRSKMKHDMLGPWFRNPKTNELSRQIKFRLSLARAFVSDDQLHRTAHPEYSVMDVIQTIAKSEEDFYYEIDQTTGFFSIPFTKLFKINTKYIIINYNNDDYSNKPRDLSRSSCSLFVYYNVVFVNRHTLKPITSLNHVEQFIKTAVLSILRNESRIMKYVLTSYVNKLGNNSKIVKSIRLGGQVGIGQNAEDASPDFKVDSMENKVIYTKGLLFKLLLRWSLLLWSKFFINTLKFFFSMLYGLMTNLMMLNRLVLTILFISLLSNIYLMQKATFDYWAFQRAENYADSVMNVKSFKLERSISLDDLDILTSELDEKNSLIDEFISSEPTAELKYKNIRNEMALKRNELLVELSTLNSIESELVSADFKTFLLKEIGRCNSVQQSHREILETNKKLQDYCQRCSQQLEYLNGLL